MARVIIIGGGASGLVSAIIARKKNHDVLILERNSICGKKILSTGNGRCNYFNDDQNIKHYHSCDEDFLSRIITDQRIEEVLTFFHQLGIIPKIKEGYYYPYSNQAISIQNTLVEEAKRLGVQIVYDTFVSLIKKDLSGYIIETVNETFQADRVILATGGMANPKLGNDGKGYSLAESLGHTVIKPLPALVQLNTTGRFLKEWSGIRADVKIKLCQDYQFVQEESGEILLTNYGVSGICVMQLSGFVARGLDEGKREQLVINFLPQFASNRQEFIQFMDDRNQLLSNRNISQLLDSILNYKLVHVLIKSASLAGSIRWNQLTIREKSILASCFVEFRLDVISTNSFQKAQVTSGGIPLSEIDMETMESKIVDDLYFAGEILDVNGDCGGYNLTFAWISGLVAGRVGENA